MLSSNMFVRCSVDPQGEEYPRYFCVGKISSINNSAETASVIFDDVDGIGEYYEKPADREYSFKQLQHVQIRNGGLVIYNWRKLIVQASVLEKDGYYYYYVSTKNGETLYICETELKAGYNNGSVYPLEQLKSCEFQKPIWFVGRSNVSRTMQIIENSLYGFKELSGCKIFLKSYQLKTVMRCLQQPTCRFMIADEVGLGKTVEAIAVLKVFLKDKHNKKVLILVPETLIEQWKTELAFKFELFEGENENGNYIEIKSINDIFKIYEIYDFIIVDEVHRLLKEISVYNALLELSKRAQNIIMLSATPIQDRREEYKKLLSLIQPEKYESIEQDKFDSLLDLQNLVIRRVHDALSGIEVLNEVIKEQNGQHTAGTEDAFDDILDSLNRIKSIINNDVYNSMIAEIDYDTEDFGILNMQTAIAFVCENYQLEKSIIRNRRVGAFEESVNIRQLKDCSYDLQSEFNNREYNVYRLLCDWIGTINLTSEIYNNKYKSIVGAFFSSAHAFDVAINSFGVSNIPEELLSCAKLWLREEKNIINKIQAYLEEPDVYCNRVTSIVDFIDQECEEKKVLIFTYYKATFEFYKKVLTKCFGEQSCCFFCDGMDRDELELNAYRFQSDKNYRILLSDETGGEGRNFQNADFVIHIDIPWEANTLEQRIGRLDRIGRDANQPVISVVSYAKETIEEDLFKLWLEGVGIFKKAQSGLEIIMNDINEKIIDTISADFKYGLSNAIPEMITLIEKQTQIVNKERYFDIAALQYSIINQSLSRSIELLRQNETEYFASAMMSWASLSGFNAEKSSRDKIIFSSNSLSYRSAQNTLFVPPDMKTVIDDKLNQLRNRIRILNGETRIKKDINYIQGTFDREIAVKNDYLHFYAPGDKIFDSIISNSVRSYKGTCAAFELPASINWRGLVFTWNVELNEALICERQINRYAINQYRGFLPSDQIITVVALSSYDVPDVIVVREFKRIFSISTGKAHHFKNFGERHGEKAYIQKFKKAFPPEKWSAGVDGAFKTAYKKAKKELQPKIAKQLQSLKQQLINEVSAQKAAAIYYSRSLDNDGVTKIEKQNEEIYKIIEAYELNLDSVCFISMKKKDNE